MHSVDVCSTSCNMISSNIFQILNIFYVFRDVKGIPVKAITHYDGSVLQDYMLQKRYSGAVKAKMKKTPTLAELKVTKHKKRVLEQRNMALIRPSEETTADGLRTLQLPSHRSGFPRHIINV